MVTRSTRSCFSCFKAWSNQSQHTQWNACARQERHDPVTSACIAYSLRDWNVVLQILKHWKYEGGLGLLVFWNWGKVGNPFFFLFFFLFHFFIFFIYSLGSVCGVQTKTNNFYLIQGPGVYLFSQNTALWMHLPRKLKGESVAAAIFGSYISIVPPDFFVEKPAKQAWVAFPAWA